LNDASTGFLLGLLVFLIIFSALFSSSETAMMSLNRFRLKHLRKSHPAADRAARLLERPDKLIGLILIGNNAVNILAALVAGILFSRWFGADAGVWVTTLLLTFIMLVFAEVTPKTIAAVHPEPIAFPISRLLKFLLLIFGPAVSALNWLTNSLVRLFGIDPTKLNDYHLSSEELRTVVDEAGNLIPDHNQFMLLGILDLERVTVNDIMVPRSEVVGLNLEQPIKELVQIITASEHTRLPVYQGDINNVVGTLHLRKFNRILHAGGESITKAAIMRFSKEPYFVPENTPLSVQLLNFRKQKRRLGFIVDEYGDIEGMVTIDDLLEEIVGSYTMTQEDEIQTITKIRENKYLIDGGMSLREINKDTLWELPTEGAKTLNGLVMEHLEALPDGLVCLMLEGQYQLETLSLGDKVIEKMRVTRVPVTPIKDEES
jgi:Mg2+/Co2+ transporter CorB